MIPVLPAVHPGHTGALPARPGHPRPGHPRPQPAVTPVTPPPPAQAESHRQPRPLPANHHLTGLICIPPPLRHAIGLSTRLVCISTRQRGGAGVSPRGTNNASFAYGLRPMGVSPASAPGGAGEGGGLRPEGPGPGPARPQPSPGAARRGNGAPGTAWREQHPADLRAVGARERGLPVRPPEPALAAGYTVRPASGPAGPRCPRCALPGLAPSQAPLVLEGLCAEWSSWFYLFIL